MEENAELWKAVEGFPNYLVSNQGRVRGPFGVLKARPDGDGNDKVALYHNGTRKDDSIGRLVLIAFIGPPPSRFHCCCHGPRGRHDHAIDNVSWGTHTDNMRDRERDGTTNRGKKVNTHEKNGMAKLTMDDVETIRKEHAAGKSQSSLAHQYGVTRVAIWQVVHNITWNTI